MTIGVRETMVNGVVADMGDGLARVDIGEPAEEWYFPIDLLPEGTRVGSEVLFVEREGTLTALSLSRRGGEARTRSIEDRLSRKVTTLRETSEVRMSDLRDALR